MASTPRLGKTEQSKAVRQKRAKEYVDDAEGFKGNKRLGKSENLSSCKKSNVNALKRRARKDPEPPCVKMSKGENGKRVAYGGGRRCDEPGCEKFSQGAGGKCIAHGGGRRCDAPGCVKSSQGAGGKCKAHGGGRRCDEPGCENSSAGANGKCKAHRVGRRCDEPEIVYSAWL